MSSTNKGAGDYNSKNGVLYVWKKDMEESLRRKTSLGKTCSLFRQETANNVDTWGFIQQFFQHLYRTANSNVHLMV